MKDININIDEWLQFLDPQNLKENLMFSSFFIASFEAFKDYIEEEVKFFFNTGFDENGYTFSKNYEIKVKSLDKSIAKASLLFLVDLEAINENDLKIFDELRVYRNKLSHELMDLMFKSMHQELPNNLILLLELRIKIEKWWILNIEIPTDPEFDNSREIKEDDITTPTQILTKLVMDMLTGDLKEASFYQNEFKKRFNR